MPVPKWSCKTTAADQDLPTIRRVLPTVTVRSRSSLRRVLTDLGAPFLTLLHGEIDDAPPIGGVHIWDPFDLSEPAFRALVLAVGVHAEQQLLALVGEAGRQGASTVVVRLPLEVTPALAAALDREHVVLLGLAIGASWAQLSAMLSTLLAEFDVGEAEPASLGGPPSGDLFAVANAVAALIDAPVTIEDRSSRVLAYSGRQDETDSGRVATILGRRVPAERLAQLEERGVFDQLNRQRSPVYVESLTTPDGENLMPRMAVAVRAGTEVLGSIWAAVPGPLSPGRSQAFGDAANLVAMHLLRLRAGTDVKRRLQTDLVGTALEGGAGSAEAMARLGLVGRPALVMALSMPEAAGSVGSPERDAAVAAERERVSDAFAMHLGALYRRSSVGMIGEVVYAILPLTAGSATDLQHAVRTAKTFIDRSNGTAVIGVGSLRSTPAGSPDHGSTPIGHCGCCWRSAGPAGSLRSTTSTSTPCCSSSTSWRRPAGPCRWAPWPGWSNTTPDTTPSWSAPCVTGWKPSATSRRRPQRLSSTPTRFGIACAGWQP